MESTSSSAPPECSEGVGAICSLIAAGADISGGVGADVIRVSRMRWRGDHLRGGRGNDVLHISGPFPRAEYRGVSAEGGPGRDRIHLYGRLEWVKVFVRADGKRDHVWCHRDSYDIVVKGPADVLHKPGAVRRRRLAPGPPCSPPVGDTP
jgi:hypothetical protein